MSVLGSLCVSRAQNSAMNEQWERAFKNQRLYAGVIVTLNEDVFIICQKRRRSVASGVGTGGSGGSVGPRAPGAPSSGATENFLGKTLRKIIKIVAAG